ncbi:hypothetical protein J0A67_15325 [Algoriphagus aestuariicola]|uniref:Uncharacterized protein n=1 Tax=Algoriphagus aestuariicola TaxID=1852016 RepID=A0ABS3BX04_9BACT|nr:hypothetical protein [Algoriphagus aestuariicola]MBN7802244.1 hypothetical protein [Algoriphagus aestuariicola]
MKKALIPVLALLVPIFLKSCTIETSKKSDGIKIEITTSDDLVINGEKINDKKLDREIKKLIRDLEKEGLSKEEIRQSISEGKSSVKEAIEEMKKELKEIKSHSKHREEAN